VKRTSLALALAVAALGGSPASAQDAVAKVGFDRDSDYALRLAQRGESRHAIWMVDRLKKTAGLTDAQKAELAFLEANVVIASFDLEDDFEKAKGLRDTAQKAIDAYLATAPKGRNVARANYLKGDLGRKFGVKVIREIKRTNSAQQAGELRKLGDESFVQAEEYFKKRADSLKATGSEQGPGSTEHNDWLAALYAIPDCFLSHADLFPEGDAKRTMNLERSISYFDDFTLECPSDLVVYFEAMVKAGNANRDLGKVDKAIEYYKQALQLLYEQDENDPTVKLPAHPDQLNDNQRQIIVDAAGAVSKLHNKMKEPAKVITLADDVRRGIPDVEHVRGSGEFLAELAKAYESQKRVDDAKKAARLAMRASRFDSDAFRDAKDILERNGEVGSGELGREEIFGPIVQALAENHAVDAIAEFMTSLRKVRAAKAEKLLPDLFLAGGWAYQKAGRQLEAVLAWEHCAELLPDGPNAADALMNSVKLLCQVWTTTKSPWFQSYAGRLVETLRDQFPDAAQTGEAQSAFVKTLQKTNGGDFAAVAQTLEDNLSRMQKTDANYGMKAIEAADAWKQAAMSAPAKSREAPRKKADALYVAYQEWADASEKTTIDPIQLGKIQERRLTAMQGRAALFLLEPGANPEKSLAILQELEPLAAKSTAASAKRIQGRVEEQKIRAYLQQGKLDAAMQIVDGLVMKTPDSPSTRAGAKFVAEAADREAAKLKKEPINGNGQRLAQLVDSAIRYYDVWIQSAQKAGNVSPKDYDTAASKLFIYGLAKNGLEFKGSFTRADVSKLVTKDAVAKAGDLFKSAIAANDANPSGDFNEAQVRYKLGQVQGYLGQWKELAENYTSVLQAAGALLSQEGGPSKLDLSPDVRKRLSGLAVSLANESAYALAQLAARGDKAAGKEAEARAAAVAAELNPGNKEGTEDWWFARWVLVLAQENNGEYATCRETIEDFLRSDKELDKGQWGFKSRILDIYERVKNK